MEPTSPVLPGQNSEQHEIRIAEKQAEYTTLTALPIDNGTQLLFRFQLDDDDRERVANGQDLYLFMATFGKPMPPILLEFATVEEIMQSDPSNSNLQAINNSVM